MFRINRGIFKTLDPGTGSYKQRFTIDQLTGKFVSLDDDGNPVADAVTTAGGTITGAFHTTHTSNTYTGAHATLGSYYINNTNTRLHEGNGNALKITTPTGYVELGSMNSGFVHLQADRDIYILPGSSNGGVKVDGHLEPYRDGSLRLGSSTRKWANIYGDALSIYGNGTVNGNLVVGGTITAQEFRSEFITNTIILESGSTQFGDSADDTHTFTGSIIATNGISGAVTIQDDAPTGADGKLWWESDTGKLKIYYGSSSAWVDAVPMPDVTTLYSKAGGAITGDVSIGQTLTVTGNTSTTGNINTTGSVSIGQALTVTGNTTSAGTTTVNGQFIFNSSLNSSYREGIRLNLSTGNWGGAVFGGVRNSISGITEAWWVARNPYKDFVISYGTSSNSAGLYLPHNSSALEYKGNRVWNASDFANNSSNWNTAYGWGNHAGLYLGATAKAADSNLLDGIDSASFLRSDANDSYNGDLEVNGMFFKDGSNANRNFKMQSNDSSGSDTGISMYNAAGTHTIQLYGTANQYGFLDGNWGGWDIRKTKNGAFEVDEGSGLKRVWNEGIFANNSDNWNTAYGWGNHASAGYLTSLPSHTHDDRYYTESESDTRFASRGFLNAAYVDFTVNGDADTFYPVRIGGSGTFGFQMYSISRGYSWTAPNTWNTATHKGGLTLTIQWSGDTAWGGNDHAIRVIQFDETYSTVAGGMALPVTGGLMVWLRGGGATYRCHSPKGVEASVTVELTGFEAGNGARYEPKSLQEAIAGQVSIRNNWPVRDNNQLYHENQEVATESWVTSTAKAADANLLDGIDSASFLRSNAADTFTSTLTMGTQHALVADNYGRGVYGVYSSTKYQHVWGMGTGYNLADNGSGTGNFYGIAWTHSNVGGESIPGLGHQMLIISNGGARTAIGDGIWTNYNITTTSYGTAANWKTAYDWGNHASAGYLTTEADTLSSVIGRGATATHAILTSDPSSRALYIRGTGNIIQFQDASSVNKWEVVGRQGAFYIYKNDGIGSGMKYQIDTSGNHILTGPVATTSTLSTNGSLEWAKQQSNSYTYSGADSTGMYIERVSTAGAGSTLADIRIQARDNNSGAYTAVRVKGSDNTVAITAGATSVSGTLTASNLSGTNTGDQDLSGYLTTSGKAADSNLLDGIDSGAFIRENEDRRYKVIRFTGESGDSGNGSISYGIYQEGGAWSHPYPDLVIAMHTGIKIGGYYGYGGTRFYNDAPKVSGATEIFSVGDGDSNIRVANNLYIGGTAYIAPVGQSMDLRKVNAISFAPNNGWNNPSVHGIKSTDHTGTNSDSVSINSYNDVTIRLDANNNNAASYLRVYNDTEGSSGELPFWTGTNNNIPKTRIYGYLGVNTEPLEANYPLNMGGSIHMNSNNIHYAQELHFSGDVRFKNSGNSNYIYLQTGSTSHGGLQLTTNGTTRGYLYYNSSNQVGLLDTGGSWAIRHTNDSGTDFFTDGETLEFTIGRDRVGGSFGTVQTYTTRNGYGGYSINGQYVFMSDHGSLAGIYNDIDNEWMTIWRRNGETELCYNGTMKFKTVSSGVWIDGNAEINQGRLQVDAGTNTSIATFSNQTGPSLNISETEVQALKELKATRQSSNDNRNLITAYGSEGNLLFSVSDLLDNSSLFSVNLKSGIPAFEVLDDSTVKIGPFATPVEVTPTGELKVNGGTNLGTAITGASVSNDTITFTRANGGTFTVTTSDANTNYYLDDITKSGNTLTYVMNGKTDLTYTFGDAAFQNALEMGTVTIQDAAPTGVDGRLWWESDTGKLKIYYGSSSAWIDALPLPDMSLYYAKAGGAITGDVSIGQTLTVSGNTLIEGTLTETSDARLKENIVSLDSPLEKVLRLRGVNFNKINTPDIKEVGFIAQEVEEVIPELITETEDGIKTVSYSRVTAVLVETVKEQQSQIEDLKEMVRALTDKVNNL